MESVAAETVATEVAPEVVAPEAAEAASTPEPRRVTGDKREMRQAVKEMAERRLRTERPRDEAGRFSSEDQPETAESSPQDPGAPQAEATTDEATPPPTTVKIPVPEGHPLREQGKEFVTVPAEEERSVRALMNGVARRSEVEAAFQRASQAEARAREAEAIAEFYRTQGPQLWTPDDQAAYDDISATYGPEAAERFKRGKLSEADQQIAQVRQDAQAQGMRAEHQQTASQFAQAAIEDATVKYPGVTEAEVLRAIYLYGAELDRIEKMTGRQPQLHADDFYRIADPLFRSNPRVADETRKQTEAREIERRRIEADIKEQQKRELAAASTRHAQNPHRALAAVPGRTVAPAEVKDNRGRDVGAIRKDARANVRAYAERLSSGS